MKKIFAILLSICALSSCTSDVGDATGSIYGVVSYSNSAEPVKGVGVELYVGMYGYGGSLLLRTTTSDDGSYSFEELTPGNYYLQVVSEGYETASYNVKVESGRMARADMQLVEKVINISVGTLAVSNVAGVGATFNGKYQVDYYIDAPTECGFIYSTSSNPKDDGKKVVAENVNGDTNSEKYFSALVSGLTPGTWYVQAYATRNKGEYDDGTAYGDVLSFEISGDPQVSTLNITNITDDSATLNGYVDYVGDPKYTEKGFVYSKSYTVPTIDDPSDATIKMPVSGSAKEFSVIIGGLEINKTYYVRTYITNQNGTTYGDVIAFKTYYEQPIVVTGEVTNVTTNNATISGVIKYEGMPSYIEKGFVYSSSYNLPTIDDPSSETTKVVVKGATNDFAANISGLIPEKTYYVRAFASNKYVTTYGDVVKFTTQSDNVYIIESAGLMVQKEDLHTRATRDDAKMLCESSSVGGYDDWRLPTLEELALLYSLRNEIGGFADSKYWSSKINYAYYTTVWYFDFSSGKSDTYSSYDYTLSATYCRVRAVRKI